jgi:hypothetical protein
MKTPDEDYKFPAVITGSGYAGGDLRHDEAIALTGDGSRSSRLMAFLSDFSGSTVNSTTAAEMFDWMDDDRAGSHVAETNDAAHWRKVAALCIKMLYYLKSKINSPSPTALPVSVFAMLHAPGLPEFDAVNGNLNMQQFAATMTARVIVRRDERGIELARQIQKLQDELTGHETRIEQKMTKAAIQNAVSDAQKYLQLPPRKDQRKAASRKRMSDSRIGQLA